MPMSTKRPSNMFKYGNQSVRPLMKRKTRWKNWKTPPLRWSVLLEKWKPLSRSCNQQWPVFNNVWAKLFRLRMKPTFWRLTPPLRPPAPVKKAKASPWWPLRLRNWPRKSRSWPMKLIPAYIMWKTAPTA